MTSLPDEAPRHLVITGGSGLIGQALTRRFEVDGHRVSRVVRSPVRQGDIPWDPVSGQLDPAALEGAHAVVHLAGENLGTRWTKAIKNRIRQSRVQGTRLLSTTLAGLQRPPSVLVSASAIGIYGDQVNRVLDETSPPGDPARDFLVSVCLEWEAATEAARAAGIRVVPARFGVVLSDRGGALGKQLLPFRLGLGGRLGSGSQWVSWICIDDTVGAIRHIIANPALDGPVNVTAPTPVINREFTETLGKVLGRPTVIRVPAAALRLAFGEMAEHTLLSSARVLPTRLVQSGYRFEYPNLEGTFRHVLDKEHGSSFPA
jgi:uncharacterized protein